MAGKTWRLGVAGLGTVGAGLLAFLAENPGFAPAGDRAEIAVVESHGNFKAVAHRDAVLDRVARNRTAYTADDAGGHRAAAAANRTAGQRTQRTAANRAQPARLAVVGADAHHAHAVDGAHTHRLFALRLRRSEDVGRTTVNRAPRHGH